MLLSSAKGELHTKYNVFAALASPLGVMQEAKSFMMAKHLQLVN